MSPATASAVNRQPLAAPMTSSDLARMSPDELAELYREGAVPASLDRLDGSPPGRMLAVRGPLGRSPMRPLIARLAASRRFPWAGKSFHANGATGTGVNRLRLAGMRSVFPFETHVVPSAIDGKPCVYLEYDIDPNPWFIRRIHDELREVAPGLYLGPAMWKTRGAPSLVLYFAIDKTGA